MLKEQSLSVPVPELLWLGIELCMATEHVYPYLKFLHCSHCMVLYGTCIIKAC